MDRLASFLGTGRLFVNGVLLVPLVAFGRDHFLDLVSADCTRLLLNAFFRAGRFFCYRPGAVFMVLRLCDLAGRTFLDLVADRAVDRLASFLGTGRLFVHGVLLVPLMAFCRDHCGFNSCLLCPLCVAEHFFAPAASPVFCIPGLCTGRFFRSSLCHAMTFCGNYDNSGFINCIAD